MPSRAYKILFQKSAFKEYKALPKEVKKRIDQVLEKYHQVSPWLLQKAGHRVADPGPPSYDVKLN